MKINSRTFTKFEGRMYNTILRAIAILISDTLYSNVKTMVSDAINPISAWTMLKTFHANIREDEWFEHFLEEKGISRTEEINFSALKEYFEQGDIELVLELPINENTKDNAFSVFYRTIQSNTKFTCQMDDNDDNDDNNMESQRKRPRLDTGGKRGRTRRCRKPNRNGCISQKHRKCKHRSIRKSYV